MPDLRAPAPVLTPSQRVAAAHRFVVVTLLGFASGLPLALTGQAMQAWLSMEGLDVATIGFLSLVGLPYTFKFLWAPLMDRFELPWLGRRRGWLVLTQLALAGVLLALAATSPSRATQAFALLAVAVAFVSASQDVVIDAYRTDLLPPSERGLGSSLNVLGYRLAMILSGGIALIWTDPNQGGGWTWPSVYRLMAALMVGAAVLSALVLPRLAPPGSQRGAAQRRAPRPDRLRRGAGRRRGRLPADRPVRDAVRALADGAAVRRQLAHAGVARALGRSAGAGVRHRSSPCRWPHGRRARARFETLLGGPGELLQRSPARRPSSR